MKRTLTLLLAAAALLTACSGPAQNVVATLSSPDGTLTANFIMTEDGAPMYDLTYGETPVMEPGGLGFELRGVVKYQGLVYEKDRILKPDELPPYMFNDSFEVRGVETDSFDEVWEPGWGEEARIRNHYNELLSSSPTRATASS